MAASIVIELRTPSVWDIATHPDIVLAAVITAVAAISIAAPRYPHVHAAAPSLMTSIGILGTFWGIYGGLQNLSFSPDHINASIEQLLEGMKTAFGTSLVGLSSGILYRIFWPCLIPGRTDRDTSTEDSGGTGP